MFLNSSLIAMAIQQKERVLSPSRASLDENSKSRQGFLQVALNLRSKLVQMWSCQIELSPVAKGKVEAIMFLPVSVFVCVSKITLN